MLRVLPALVVSTFVLGGVAQAAQGGYYKTKADEKAGKVTPGRPTAARADAPKTGGETCATATAIAALPFNDSDDTTGNVDDNGTLPAGCSDYTTTAGPDLIYSFTTGAGNSVAFTVTPTTATYDVSIYVLGTCGSSATCVIGADACLANNQPQVPGCIDGDGDEDIPATAFASGTHAFYVDSFYAAGAPCGGQGNQICGSGAYNLSVTGTLPAELLNIGIE